MISLLLLAITHTHLRCSLHKVSNAIFGVIEFIDSISSSLNLLLNPAEKGFAVSRDADWKLLLYSLTNQIQWVLIKDNTSSSVKILLYKVLSAEVNKVSQNFKTVVVSKKLIGTVKVSVLIWFFLDSFDALNLL